MQRRPWTRTLVFNNRETNDSSGRFPLLSRWSLSAFWWRSLVVHSGVFKQKRVKVSRYLTWPVHYYLKKEKEGVFPGEKKDFATRDTTLFFFVFVFFFSRCDHDDDDDHHHLLRNDDDF